MKPVLLATALLGSTALAALAQDAQSPFQTESMGPSVQASDVIGARVYASETALDADAYPGVQEGWNDVGEVNDIILGRDGTVDAVLVDIGGFLGIGERQVAVDMSALRFIQDDATDADDWFMVLQADRATLEGAPAWVNPAAAGMDQNATDGASNGTVDPEAATTGEAAGTDGDAAGNATATEAGTEDNDGMTATGDTAANDGSATTGDTAATADTAVATDNGKTGMALPEGYTAVAPDALTADVLQGANVRDAEDNAIADVSDLVLTEDGQVTHVVLDVGGFLGMGARSVALPLEDLTIAQREDGRVDLWVNLTREQLESLPEYKM